MIIKFQLILQNIDKFIANILLMIAYMFINLIKVAQTSSVGHKNNSRHGVSFCIKFVLAYTITGVISTSCL